MKKGFTLIELLVVVLIIGILSAVALPQYEKAVLKTRLATVKNLTKAVSQAQEIYYMANGEYSADLTSLDIELPNGGTVTNDGKVISYENKSCTIEDPLNIICSYQQNGKRIISYLAYYVNINFEHKGKILCQAKGGTVGETVCKQDTGKKECLYWGNNIATCFYD
ncbi:MAG: prepilin-type N-terminal cleavage/methylation domain-containing protein [Elusimicrobiaceae bacterium]|nr:prepilin-type N-terminal cleavage/methylation domain-containing protein [Elusimicrobiaceae bacterium]